MYPRVPHAGTYRLAMPARRDPERDVSVSLAPLDPETAPRALLAVKPADEDGKGQQPEPSEEADWR